MEGGKSVNPHGDSPPPTPEATYERARRLTNLAIWTVSLQCRRLRANEPEDGVFAFRRLADFDFLIVALSRLRRAATIAAAIPGVRQDLTDAIAQFDLALPDLKKLRDVAEHIDEYALDSGRVRSVVRQELEVSTLSDDGTTLSWLGCSISSSEALRASQALFAAIQSASPSPSASG
jgi:hypothetical protein